ncbi:MAG: ATP synthase A1 subunit C [Candidatus Methanofastidiosia archaeon]
MPLLKSKLADFAYITARVRVMRRKLLRKEVYPRLQAMEIPGIARFLGETEYKEDIDLLSSKFSGVDLIEHALNSNLAKTFTKLIDISEGGANLMIKEYLKVWDVRNLKTIIRGIYYEADYEELVRTIAPAGEFSYEFLLTLARRRSFEEVIEELRSTPYHKVLKENLKKDELKRGVTLQQAEDALDKFYYLRVVDMIDPSSAENALFLKFFKTEIDVTNLNVLFRMLKAGVSSKEILNSLILKGLKFKPSDLKRFATLSYEEFFRNLENYPYWSDLSELRDAPLSEIEVSLKKYLIDYSQRISHYYPLSILPVMLYIRSKEAEIKNLRMIVRAKEVGLSMEVIKKHLVI